MRRLATFFSLLLLFQAAALAGFTAEQRRINLEAFDRVWDTVRDKHWDPSLGGLNWQAVRDELRPQIETAQSDEQVRAIMTDMLSRLHQSHFLVIPGSVYHDVEGPAASEDSAAQATAEEDGTVGIEVRVVDGQALVFRVEPNSSAARHGVHPGWIIQRLSEVDVAPVLRRVAATYQDSTQKDMMLARVVEGKLSGPLVNQIEVEFRDERDRPVTLSLERQPPRGEPARFGFLPESSLWIDTHRIGADVEYIAFTFFLDPEKLTRAFQEAVRGCSGCSGIVIDLRGNPGGLGLLASGLAGFFLDKPDQKLGTMYMRNLPLKFVVNPRPPVYTGPVAVLIDGLSASTSEIFAGGLQDLHRARIFGSRSAGATLASMIERLPNGDGFQYAAAFYKSESGRALEGAGVIPDEPVPVTRSSLLAGHDAALDAALRWIHRPTSKGTTTP